MCHISKLIGDKMHQTLEDLEDMSWINTTFDVKKKEEEPRNNDGRTFCYFCSARTKKVQGFRWIYDVCSSVVCGK